jgi:hypothetical protein
MGITSNSPGTIKIKSTNEKIVDIDGITADPEQIGVAVVEVEQEETSNYNPGTSSFTITVLEDPNDPDSDGDGTPNSIDQDDDGDGVLDIDEQSVSISITPDSITFDFDQYSLDVAEAFAVDCKGTNAIKGYTFTFPEGYAGEVDGVIKNPGDEVVITDNDAHFLKIHPISRRTVKPTSDDTILTFTTRDDNIDGEKLTATLSLRQNGDENAPMPNELGSGIFSFVDNSDITTGPGQFLPDQFDFTITDFDIIGIFVTTDINNPTPVNTERVLGINYGGGTGYTVIRNFKYPSSYDSNVANEINWEDGKPFYNTNASKLNFIDSGYNLGGPTTYWVFATDRYEFVDEVQLGPNFTDAYRLNKILDSIKITRKPTKGLLLKNSYDNLIFDGTELPLEDVTPNSQTITVEALSSDDTGWNTEIQSILKTKGLESSTLLMDDGSVVTYGDSNTPLKVNDIVVTSAYNNLKIGAPFEAAQAFDNWFREQISLNPVVFKASDGKFFIAPMVNSFGATNEPYFINQNFGKNTYRTPGDNNFLNHSTKQFSNLDSNDPNFYFSSIGYYNGNIFTKQFHLGFSSPYVTTETEEDPKFCKQILYGSTNATDLIISPSSATTDNQPNGSPHQVDISWANENPNVGYSRKRKVDFVLNQDSSFKSSIVFSQNPSMSIINTIWEDENKTAEVVGTQTIPNTLSQSGKPNGELTVYFETNCLYSIKVIGPYTCNLLSGGENNILNLIPLTVKPKFFNKSSSPIPGRIIIECTGGNETVTNALEVVTPAFVPESIIVNSTPTEYNVPTFPATSGSPVALTLQTNYSYWDLNTYESTGWNVTSTANTETTGTITITPTNAGIDGRAGNVKVISPMGQEYIIGLSQEKLIREYFIQEESVNNGLHTTLGLTLSGWNINFPIISNDTFHGLTWEADLPSLLNETLGSITKKGNVNEDLLVVNFPNNSRPGSNDVNVDFPVRFKDELGDVIHNVSINAIQPGTPRYFYYEGIEIQNGDAFSKNINSLGVTGVLDIDSNDELIYFEVDEVSDSDNMLTVTNPDGRVETNPGIIIPQQFGGDPERTAQITVKYKDQGPEGDQYSQITSTFVQEAGPVPYYSITDNSDNNVEQTTVLFGAEDNDNPPGDLTEEAAQSASEQHVRQADIRLLAKTNVKGATLDVSSDIVRFYDIKNDNTVYGSSVSNIEIDEDDGNYFESRVSIWVLENKGVDKKGTITFNFKKNGTIVESKTMSVEQSGLAPSGLFEIPSPGTGLKATGVSYFFHPRRGYRGAGYRNFAASSALLSSETSPSNPWWGGYNSTDSWDGVTIGTGGREHGTTHTHVDTFRPSAIANTGNPNDSFANWKVGIISTNGQWLLRPEDPYVYPTDGSPFVYPGFGQVVGPSTEGVASIGGDWYCMKSDYFDADNGMPPSQTSLLRDAGALWFNSSWGADKSAVRIYFASSSGASYYIGFPYFNDVDSITPFDVVGSICPVVGIVWGVGDSYDFKAESVTWVGGGSSVNRYSYRGPQEVHSKLQNFYSSFDVYLQYPDHIGSVN